MRHLLATNDYPPKIGGIQSYLWELWRRLPADEFSVFTTPYRGSQRWDAEQAYRVVRARDKVLLPRPGMATTIDKVAADNDAQLVLLDPAVPIGLVGRRLALPYGVVLHGAEVTVPGRTPVMRGLLAGVLERASILIAAGGYPLDEAHHALGKRTVPPTVVVPPGVDTDRFRPLSADERDQARHRYGFAAGAPVITSLSRLVPRKGMDTLIQASVRLQGQHPDLVVAIAGSGRDRNRLEGLIQQHRAPVRLVGRVPDSDLPGFLGCSDAFAMLCRNRWFGLEQEGFGIVFLEAAACGIPQVAGRSGGAHEAVEHGETGFVVDDPTDIDEVVDALDKLLSDPARRSSMGEAARVRAQTEFDYSVLSNRLRDALAGLPL